MDMYVCMYVCMNVCMYVCRYVCSLYECIFAWLCRYMVVSMYAGTNFCVCIKVLSLIVCVVDF